MANSWSRLGLGLLLWLCCAAQGAAQTDSAVARDNAMPPVPGKRLALVIGNDAYQHVSRLEKATNDANDMARELRAASFDVTLGIDLHYRDMVKRVESFTRRIGGGDQVVVFYAGHGVQLRSGNFLLPVDIESNSESEIEKTAYGLHDLMEKLAESKAAFSLVLLDACRDNPLRANGRALGSLLGLSAVEPPRGQMVVYSASKGQRALEKIDPNDTHPNGVFTRELLARIRQPGLRIEDMMREVQTAVEQKTLAVQHEQRPAIYNESRGNFYFYPPPAGAQAPVLASAPATDDSETVFWNAVKSNGSRDYLEAYLAQYPKGKYAALARLDLKNLGSSEPAARTANNPTTTTTTTARAAPQTKAAEPAKPAPAPVTEYPVAHIAYQQKNWVLVVADSAFFEGAQGQKEARFRDIQNCVREARFGGETVVLARVGNELRFYGPTALASYFRAVDPAWLRERINRRISCPA